MNPTRAAWRSLVRRISATTRSDSPEDLLQEAFVRLQEYSARAPVENAGAFLMRTAINLSHDERRRGRFRHAVDPADRAVLELSDENPLQDEVFATRERLRAVQRALALLPPRTREVFLMRRVDGLKYSEIAQRLEISVSAVEKHVAKAVLFIANYASDEE